MAKTLEEHFCYLSDPVKIRQYQAAIDACVKPEHVVLDLGCGTGLLGLMALRAGARKAYFLEEGAIIEAARQTVAAAGFADKAEYFQGNSFELELPEQADIVICDHIGYFGFDYGALALLADAKKRFLKPNGVIIPARVELMLAPVESKDCRKLVGRWSDGSIPEDFGWLGNAAANNKYGVELLPENLLANAESLEAIELGADATPFMSWTSQFEMSRDGTLDGLAGMFACRLFDDTDMTNVPNTPDTIDRPQAFFPLEAPVAVSARERVSATVMARPDDHIIAWVVELPDSGQRIALTTFNGHLLNNAALSGARTDRVARLNAHGRARQVVLSFCDGQRTVAEIQALVQRKHPTLFPSASATASFITRVLTQDTSA